MVVDHAGAATWRDPLASLARGCRLLTCGATTGPHPETDINNIFCNQLFVVDSTMYRTLSGRARWTRTSV
ncbi:MAG: hypothetical protein J07HX64_00279 [halophilic archaeon J07HX64]|nr:MAG: hypothetical protein J07HX64_00279 [halophilic archaeon J07HX64]